jgi:(2Fe-2S) ferredoxin
MKPHFFKTNAHILICTDERCLRDGSRLLFQAVWQSFESEKIAYYKTGGNLRLTESGCLGACQFGPTVACYFKRDSHLEQAWYQRMTYPKIMQLARALRDGLELPLEGRFDSD